MRYTTSSLWIGVCRIWMALKRFVKFATSLTQYAPKVLMVSAYDRDEAKGKAMGLGISGFLEKPINQSVLMDYLIEMMSGYHVEQDHVVEFAAPNLEGYNLLLVEDNAINRQVAMGFLADTKAHITIAENGQIALDKLQLQSFDLVLMDIQMPVLDGLSATELKSSEIKYGLTCCCYDCPCYGW